MRIEIIGGGPAGLYFAILAKQRFPQWSIRVSERNGRNDTFGWGVVFSDRTLEHFREHDPISYATLADAIITWEDVDVVHQGVHTRIHGNKFSGISRLKMLNILSDRAESLGIDVEFNCDIKDLGERRTADLVVIADGVNSIFRKQFADFFQPSISVRPNKYIWYGTHHLFDALTLTFHKNEHGIFASHSYKFDDTTSTFVVECDPDTWKAAGLDTMTEEACRTYLERVFANDLQGGRLLSNRSQWINFQLITNQRWVHENMVIVGDVAHTAHFSIGSGTKLAMESSIALFHAFEQTQNVSEALSLFERTRKPIVEEYQQYAYDSLVLFENLRDVIDLSPLEMAYRMMTRSKRLDHERLRKRDPQFIAAVEQLRKD